MGTHFSAHMLIVLSWSKERTDRDCCNVCAVCVFDVFIGVCMQGDC